MRPWNYAHPLVLLSFCVPAIAADWRVEIRPAGLSEVDQKALIATVLEDPSFAARTAGHRIRVLNSQFGERNLDEGDKASPRDDGYSAFRLDVWDYSANQLLKVFGTLGGSADRSRIQVSASTTMIPPTGDEIAEAIQVLKADPYFGKNPENWVADEAMPSLIDLGKGDRVVSLSVYPKGRTQYRYEIVGVNLSRLKVVRFPGGAPPTAVAEATTCAPGSAGQGVTARGTAGSAQIRITDPGDNEVWRFQATRPSASGGNWGSGIDLKDVFYRGNKILSRANTPIMNVQYVGDYCGPYRDWQYSENPFDAKGSQIASGIIQASAEPSTILETEKDAGTFRGIAVFRKPGETLLMTEISAGWYRYELRWRFLDDGTIVPGLAYGAIQSACTCHEHNHHGYFRLDFELGSGKNRVQYWDGSSWKDISAEARQRRDASHLRWRVLDLATRTGYEIVPGASDGTADAFGKGDFWALQYMPNQMDDASAYSGESANIDQFLTNQSIVDQDLVIWYGVHFDHHVDDGRHASGLLGPTLRPFTF